MKEIALLGATASGKSALAVELAQKHDANILSLDSLSIYKEVDIVSAKPTKNQRKKIKHFGIDVLYIDSYFSAATFFDLYKEAKSQSLKDKKNLIIVGGTGFYLKSMMAGLSAKLSISDKTKKEVEKTLKNLSHAYIFIEKNDPEYAAKISSNDRYRIQKWYEIYHEKKVVATVYFKQNQREPIIKDLTVFEIEIDRRTLTDRIKFRTEQMIKEGLIDEVFYLEKKYTRIPNPMKAIGIKESLDYLDGKMSLTSLKEQIEIHTLQLAKRQSTFNASQFPQKIKLLKDDLIKNIDNYFNEYINIGKIKL